MSEELSDALRWATGVVVLLGVPLLIYAAGSIWKGEAYPAERRNILMSYYGLQVLSTIGTLVSFGELSVMGLPMATMLFGMPFLAVVIALIMPMSRRFKGRCFDCGYDVTFSVSRCPECGAGLPHAPEERWTRGFVNAPNAATKPENPATAPAPSSSVLPSTT